MAPEDGRPLQEELVLVGWLLWSPWLIKIGVLQADTLELREPDRQVRRVGFGIANGAVDVLSKVEEEPGVEAAAQARLQVAVQSPGTVALEDRGR